MKKHLIAAAVAAAIAAPAMAQNVTLYGNFDVGVARLTNTNAAGNSDIYYTDGAVASSIFGFRGSEDLGGGLRAVFDVQGDVYTNNGAEDHRGIFHRAAFAGIAGAFGEVTFGTRMHPMIVTNGALMPASGNSVSTPTAANFGFSNGFFTRNAVTWVSPNMNGLTAQFQYGFDNTAEANGSGGSVIGGNVHFTSGNLTLRAALDRRNHSGTSSSAGALSGNVDKDAQIYGISYRMGAFTLAAAAIRTAAATTAGGAKTDRDGSQFGLGWQASPAWLLGTSITTGEGSSLFNAQARYSLSKRTTMYLQYGQASNGDRGVVNFTPYGGNSGTTIAALYNGYSAVTAKTQSGFGGGLIHSF